jgi:hypothetical protein
MFKHTAKRRSGCLTQTAVRHPLHFSDQIKGFVEVGKFSLPPG